MAEISLTEAVNIISTIKGQIKDIYSKMDGISTLTFPKGEPRPEATSEVDDAMAKVEALESDLMELSTAVEVANNNNLVDFQIDGKPLTIAEAIKLAQILRAKLNVLKILSNKPAQPVLQRSFHSTDSVYEVANFDVDHYKKLTEALERRVNRLSLSIDRANANISIEFVNVGKYLE